MKQKLLKTMLLLCTLIVGSGTMWADELTLTASSGFGSSYGTNHTFTASGIGFKDSGVMYNGKGNPSGFALKQVVQMRKSGSGAGVIYNTTAISTITSVEVTLVNNNNSFTLYYGTTENPSTNSIASSSLTPVTGTFSYTNTSGSTVSATSYKITFDLSSYDPTYIKIENGSSANYVGNIVINYEEAASPCATPTFSPAGGTYGSTQSVTISTETGGATIHYTTDGSTPTSSSTTYSGAITVSSTQTIKAIAVKDGNSNSEVATATYTIATPCATPTFSVAAGTYTSDQSVTLSTATADATIYYTTDGTTPSSSNGTAYSSAITVSASQTIKAIAVKDGYADSDVASATYTINKTTPSLSFEEDSYDANLGSPFSAPTLTNTNSVSPITYSSSNTDAATVNESTGVISLVGEGSTTITAYFAGNASYTAANASYTLNVSDPAVATTVTISAEGITNTDVYVSTTAGSFAATVKDNEDATIVGAVVTWTSSNTDVATINSSTGAVTLVAKGVTTITATYEGAQYSYLGSSKTYSLTVTDTTPMLPFELVTNVSQLTEGDVITFVNEDAEVALGTSRGNNYGAVSIDIEDHAFEISPSNTTITRLTLQAISESSNWYLKINESYYLAATSSTSNYMGTGLFGDNNAKASISISSNDATIVFQGSNTRNHVRFNPNSGTPIFSCYASSSSMAKPQIYKKVKFNNTITTTTAYMVDVTKTPTPDTGVTFSATATDGTIYYVLKSSTLDAEEYDLTGNVLSVESTAKSGVIVVTAKCDETSTHKAAEDVDITITIKGVAVDPTINVDDQNVEYSSTYTIDPSGFFSGPITSVTSSNTAVATVALVTGDYIVTGLAVGSATITINTAADGEGLYKAGSGSFTVNVTAPAGSTSAAEGESMTTTFINKDFGYDDPGLDWSSTDTATRSFESSGNARGVQIGAGVGEFTLSSTNSLPVASVSMIVSTNNASTNTLAVSVGGNAFTTDAGGSSATSYTMPSANNQSITFTGDGSGNIVIAVDDDTKTVWFKSITVTYIATDNVTLNANGYATYCSQYPMDFSKADGYTAWYPSAITADGTITFTKVTTGIKGGQGVLLRGDASGVVTVYSCNSSTTLDGNKFVGTTAPVYFSAAAQAYGLSGKTFVKNSTAGSIPAKKAYIPASNLPAEAKTFTLVFEDPATGITETRPATREEVEGIFNLGGQRLHKPQRGINIVNGKKVLVK